MTIDPINNLYATDGACHNAEPNTYGHECGKRAQFLGKSRFGFWSGYCRDCKVNGSEAKTCVAWREHPSNAFDT